MALQGRLRFGPFRIDAERQLLTRDDSAIHLRPKAWELLCHLVDRAGGLVSHDELLNRLWGETAIQPQALTRLIFELRQVLESDTEIRIENVARRGYRLIAQIEPEVETPAATAMLSAVTSPHLIGRTADLAILETCWQKARNGQRQLLFLGGEPGIGKTTLVSAFLEKLAGSAVAGGQCPRRHGEAEPYMVVLDALERLGERLPLAPTLRRFAPAWLVQMPWLISPDESNSLRQSLAGIGEARMLREGIRLLEALSADEPLVLVLEDLHWADTATIDLVGALGERTNPARLLVIGTYRTTEIALNSHPLRETVSHLVHRGGAATRLVLDTFGPASVQAYLQARFGDGDLARRVTPVLERKSGGNPLFLSSLTDCLVGDGTIVRQDESWVLSASIKNLDVALPDGLREIIGEQLARLLPEQCELLEAASAAGEEFTAHELAAGLGRSEDQVESACIDLARHSQFVRHLGERPWPDGTRVQTFALGHALYAQVLAERIAPLRRRTLHTRIGERLEAAYGAQSIEIAVRLASIFEAAGNVDKQASYFELAALRAYQRFAYRETGECIAQAIAAIRMLPPAPERARREAERWLDLANISIVAFGFNDGRARQAFDRSWELSRDGIDPLIAFRAQLGRCLTALMSFEYQGESTAELFELAGSALQLAQGRPELLAAAHMYNACTYHGLGEFRTALDHCEAARTHLAIAMPGIPRDADLEMTLSIFQARALVPLARIASSREYSDSALARLRILSLPQQQVAGNALLAEAALERRDDNLARQLAATAVAVASESGVGNYQLLARALLACTQLGIEANAFEEVENALQARRAVGERWCETPILLRLSAFCRTRGELERAGQYMSDATRLNEHQFIAEVWRELGEISDAQTKDSEAKDYFQNALAKARLQGALLYEARAAVALGRLLIATGRQAEALTLVTDVRDRFPPADDSPDVRDLLSLAGAVKQAIS